ncbi:Imm63 family immunity protein [Aquirhabdus sp.]|uniref:Imm63 family immunity protein n=1 Tax=Aquirhabdus sp. TaxID=2824160 RepID=UPI00396C41A8
MTFEEIREQIQILGTLGEIPHTYLKVFPQSPQNGTPHIEVKEKSYDYVVQERGYEFSRQSTTDLDTLLFWVLSNAASLYAFDYESRHRKLNEDTRQQAFAITVSIMDKINSEWGTRTQEKISAILIDAPYHM